MQRTSGLPTSPAAWGVTLTGIVALILCAWLSFQALAVGFGFATVAAGGGEFMIALFLGAPLLVLGTVCLGIATARAAWRSVLSVCGLVAALVLGVALIVAFVR